MNTEEKPKPFSQAQIVELHRKYVQNIAQYPALLAELSQQLGVSTMSLREYQVGFIPLTPYDTGPAWAFPERNEHGDIIGITVRMTNGKKWEIPGSKRGLNYKVNYETEGYEKKKWVRVSKENPCVLCNKSDGCMYPDGEADNPAAVCCVHIEQGSVRPLGVGYLHIIDPARNSMRTRGGILSQSALPTLVVEGASDAIAATDMGFVAVGRANYAVGDEDALMSLVKGRDVVIVGDRDKETKVGEKGMESVYTAIRDVCKTCIKLLPPEGIKDLREWKNNGLTQDQLLEYVKTTGDTKLRHDVLTDNLATTVGDELLKAKWTQNGKLTLGKYKGRYIEYVGGCYRDIEDGANSLQCDIINYQKDKMYVNYEDKKIKKFSQSIPFARCVIAAINNSILVKESAPCWRNDKHSGLNPKRIISFTNGWLHADEYRNGIVTLHNPDPDLVSFNSIPYPFDPNAESKIWEDFVNEIFNSDKESIQLLSEWFGNCLVADPTYQEMMIFIGPTSSGKSTTLQALKSLLGDKNYAATDYKTIGGRFGRQNLIGKLAAIMGDIRNPSPREAEDILTLFLQIVGSDDVVVDQKNKDILTLQLPVRFTMACNSLPQFRDDDLAFHRRVNILRFPNSYLGKEDKGLAERLEEEAQAGKLINWALRGLGSLYQNDGLIVPAVSQQDMNMFKEITSPISSFVDECLEKVDDHITKERTSDLFGLWQWWCKNNGLDYEEKNVFVRKLLDANPGSRLIRHTIDGKPQIKVVTRIRINKAVKQSWTQGEVI